MSNALLHAFELHDADGIRRLVDDGIDLNALIDGKPPLMWLIEMYTRSPRFTDCLKAMREGGADIRDRGLFAILCDDEASFDGNVDGRVELDCAYTSLKGVSYLHLCAEYNSVKCAHALIRAGADVNARADLQADGTGGHTPVFHTVNSNGNHCRPMMELLIQAGAALDLRIDAVVWGRGFDWETTVFDVTPISYAQCGLLPQFHRVPATIYDNIGYMYRHRHGTSAPVRNVPNRYLDS